MIRAASKANARWRQIKADISQGKNIPHLASILAAIFLVSAKSLGFLVDPLILPVAIGILGLLMANSIRHSWLLEQMQPRITGSPIKVHPEWHSEEVWATLETASKSIFLLQSWFPDSSVLADSIARTARVHPPDDPLQVRIFLLDPEDDLGARRVRELDRRDERKTTEQCREKHRHHFEHSVDGFVDRLGGLATVNLEIYAYSTLPALKLYVVDERQFLFGWLGLEGPSTLNVCLQVSSAFGDPSTERIVSRLKAHRDALTKHETTRRIWPSSTQHALSGRGLR